MEKNSRIILAKNIKIDKNNVTRLSNADLLSVLRDNSHLMYEGTDFEFIKNNKISLPCSYQTALSSNYIYFNNRNYYNKGFFAWITNVEYINDGCTEITYEIDTWSTWYDSLQFLRCFVNREMVTDDTIGEHTIPEDLDTGEMIAESVRVQDMSSQCYIAILSNYKPAINGSYTFSGISMYNGGIFGSGLLIFPLASATDFDSLNSFFKRADVDSKTENIKDMFFVPYEVIDVSEMVQESFDYNNNTYNFYTLPYSRSIYHDTIEFLKDFSISNYTIKNNKLKTYPYQYLYLTNNNGDNSILKYENFSGNNVSLDNIFALVIGGSGKLIPKNYKGVSKNFEEGLSLGKLPTCQWSSDSYTNWLTQNAVNEKNQEIKAGMGLVKNALNMDFGSALTSGAEYALNKMDRFYQANLLPNKTSGTNTGDVVFNSHNNNYEIWRMRPKLEYIKILDEFFSRFGYRVNSLKIPNIATRTYWNYVEIGANERSAITNPSSSYPVPQSDLDDINDKLRKGLTIWNNAGNIGNYSLDNSIN